METKPGYKTTEFWVTAIVNIALAVFGILAARGLISEQESALWVTLVQAIAVAVVPLAMGYVSKAYIDGRKEVKLESLKLEMMKAENAAQ